MENGAAFLDAMSNLGEGLLFTLGVIAILAFVAIKAIPIYQTFLENKSAIDRERMENEAEIAKMREERKAKEEERLAQRDLERSQMEGRWLAQYEHATAVQEQTNAVIAGMSEQTHVLNTTLTDSKERSQKMAEKVDEIHEATVKK